eukprot:Rhum_TRINITY_DN4047_c0_g1::Rhum_TRINITY_DN4047_c0_g1_i1::g.12824::m.12824
MRNPAQEKKPKAMHPPHPSRETPYQTQKGGEGEARCGGRERRHTHQKRRGKGERKRERGGNVLHYCWAKSRGGEGSGGKSAHLAFGLVSPQLLRGGFVLEPVEHLLEADAGLLAVVEGGHRHKVARVVAVDADVLAVLVVALQLVQELVHLLRLLLLGRLRHAGVLHLRQVLEGPATLAAALGLVGVVLAHEDDGGDELGGVLVDVVAVEVDAAHVVAEGEVAGLERVAQVAAHDVLLVHADLVLPAHGDIRKLVLSVLLATNLLDVHDVKDREDTARCDRREGVLPVRGARNLLCRQRPRVDDDDVAEDLDGDDDGADAAQLLVEGPGEADDVLAADGGDVEPVRVVEVRRVVLQVGRDELLGVDAARRRQGVEELHKLQGGAAAVEEEVEAVGLGLDLQAVEVHAVLEDKLLEVQDHPLVLHALPQLRHAAPLLLARRDLRARLALDRVHHELHHVVLLQHRSTEDLLLQGQLDLQTSAVRLRPDPRRVDEVHFVHALDLLQAQRHQLLRLELALHPVLWRLQVPLARLAPGDGDLLRDAGGDVDRRLQTLQAHVGGVRLDVLTAHAAQGVGDVTPGVHVRLVLRQPVLWLNLQGTVHCACCCVVLCSNEVQIL